MDFPLVPVVHGEGQHMLVAPTSPPSLEAGAHPPTWLEPLSQLESLRRCHTPLSEEKYSDLAAECVPGPGATHLLPPGCLQQRLHDPTRWEDPLPSYRQRRKGLWSHHLDSKYWVVVSLQLATDGHRVLPLTIKGQDHFCYLQAISSGTARWCPYRARTDVSAPFPPYPSLSLATTSELSWHHGNWAVSPHTFPSRPPCAPGRTLAVPCWPPRRAPTFFANPTPHQLHSA